MKIDLRSIKFLNRDGSEKMLQVPCWKMIADAIYDRADTKALDVLSDKLWRSDGEVELEAIEIELMKACLETIPFFVWLKEPIIVYLNDLITNKN